MKLPMFGETDVDAILVEIEACTKSSPKQPYLSAGLRQLCTISWYCNGRPPRRFCLKKRLGKTKDQALSLITSRKGFFI